MLIAGTTSGRASRPQQYENGWDAPYQNPNNWTPNPYQNWEGWPPPAHAGEVGQNLVNWRTGVLPDAGSTKEQPVLHRPFFIRRTLIFCKLCQICASDVWIDQFNGRSAVRAMCSLKPDAIQFHR